MKINANSIDEIEVQVSSTTVSVVIGTRETLNFTTGYVLALHPNETWVLPQPLGHPRRTINVGALAAIRKQIEKVRRWDEHFDDSPEDLRALQDNIDESVKKLAAPRMLSHRDGWTFEQAGRGTMASHDDGRRYWWPDEMAEEVLPKVLGDDWKDVGYTSQDGLDLGPEYSNRWDKPLRDGYVIAHRGIVADTIKTGNWPY